MLFWLSATRSTHALWGMNVLGECGGGNDSDQERGDGQAGLHGTSDDAATVADRRAARRVKGRDLQNFSCSFWSFGAMITRQ